MGYLTRSDARRARKRQHSDEYFDAETLHESSSDTAEAHAARTGSEDQLWQSLLTGQGISFEVHESSADSSVSSHVMSDTAELSVRKRTAPVPPPEVAALPSQPALTKSAAPTASQPEIQAQAQVETSTELPAVVEPTPVSPVDDLAWVESFAAAARSVDTSAGEDHAGITEAEDLPVLDEAADEATIGEPVATTASEAFEAPQEPEAPAAPLTSRERAMARAGELNLPFIDLTEYAIDASVTGLIPDNIARTHLALPVARIGNRVMVAMADPRNVIVLDDLAAVLQAPIAPVVAEAEAIEAAIARFHRVDSEVEELTSAFQGSAETAAQQMAPDVADQGTEDAPIIRIVNLIISQAITDRASDIHIEPGRDDLRVRYRIDGVLTTVQNVPRSMIAGVISRLKVMADLDIGERRKPQDGRISIVHSGRTVDLRVATLPTVWGEKVVARVLDAPVASLKLADLGMLDRNLDVFKKSFSKPYGMILVTGPTGSGKSTTLYTTLATISKPTVNVITVEDPVEYRMAGINQVQVNAKAGMTFAAALRSILRSDPDVILLGEIRDEETAKIAIESSLTGHLVLSTLHTNDAPSSVTRLVEMGVEPFLVASALDSVVAQRLARRLCSKCKQPGKATEVDMRMLGLWEEGMELPDVFLPVGCTQCSQTGYRGRIALHEVMAVDGEIERLASSGASAADIAAHAEKEGMARLRMDGVAKVLEGHTTIEEVLRVTL